MPIRTRPGIKPSEITDQKLSLGRRRFLTGVAAAGLLAVPLAATAGKSARGTGLSGLTKSTFSTDEEPTGYEDVTGYNNFYELGTDKRDPAKNAHHLRTRPWSVEVGGECEKPGHIDIEDVLRLFTLEERVYRLRCVEGWSMVIPWVGFPLAALIKRFAPTSRAKYVAFETLYDPERLPGQRRRLLDWPYREGLRMDEATHPLTLMAVGLYGELLPAQNGAPLRLVVPWKYGFKSIKSIVRIRFQSTEPATTWSGLGSKEYGFYANVNPNVDHPRWSQRYERRIGAGIFAPKRETLMFNGYGEQVASLYRDMDLSRFY